jgi:hypothetical protein
MLLLFKAQIVAVIVSAAPKLKECVKIDFIHKGETALKRDIE